MRFGVISDTHGYLNRKVQEYFTGLDGILHAGDIGRDEVLQGLGDMAEVNAVRGNTDQSGLAYHQPEHRCLRLGDFTVLVTHIAGLPGPIAPRARALIEDCAPRVVVFGHSHAVCHQEKDGILFLNPGSAGRARFGTPPSVALLHLEGQTPRAEIIYLE